MNLFDCHYFIGWMHMFIRFVHIESHGIPQQHWMESMIQVGRSAQCECIYFCFLPCHQHFWQNWENSLCHDVTNYKFTNVNLRLLVFLKSWQKKEKKKPQIAKQNNKTNALKWMYFWSMVGQYVVCVWLFYDIF